MVIKTLLFSKRKLRNLRPPKYVRLIVNPLTAAGKEAMQKPVETVFSGPAASVAGARFLTGLDNAMVVDIGGTTSDSTDIVGGEVAVAPEVAVVGDIQTHVRALKMKTKGVGWDSHIKFFAIKP